jgi:UDP:flavonoid glycosyltransferase YjiC (YdhE family)
MKAPHGDVAVAAILMGWELGEGLGHVQRLLRIARPLAAQGHRPIFALCNVVECWPLFQHESFAVVQAPYWNYRQQHGQQPFIASSLADVLAVRGWETTATLRPLVEAWQQLLRLVKPQLIVTDFAPTLCLTAYQDLPVVQVGNWFPLPPAHAPTFPILVPGQPPTLPQEDLLKVVQEVQRQRGRAVPPTLTSIFAAGPRFPTFFPELDPYQKERTEPVWDPFEPIQPLATVNPEPRFFAYLTADNPLVEPVLTQMALTGCPGTAYLRSASAALKERLRLQGLVILDGLAPIRDMMEQSAVIVHHGGSNLANTALAAGRPQIVLPQHLEQGTTAQLLAQLGVAVVLVGQRAPDAAGRALRQVLGEPRYTEYAYSLAQQLQARQRRDALPAILEQCRLRLGQQP